MTCFILPIRNVQKLAKAIKSHAIINGRLVLRIIVFRPKASTIGPPKSAPTKADKGMIKPVMFALTPSNAEDMYAFAKPIIIDPTETATAAKI